MSQFRLAAGKRKEWNPWRTCPAVLCYAPGWRIISHSGDYSGLSKSMIQWFLLYHGTVIFSPVGSILTAVYRKGIILRVLKAYFRFFGNYRFFLDSFVLLKDRPVVYDNKVMRSFDDTSNRMIVDVWYMMTE